MTDIEIAQAAKAEPIDSIAERAGIAPEYLEHYGRYKAKVSLSLLGEKERSPDGKLILVTAINPTPAGEGKTTTTVGLADALRRIGKNSVVALREPSLGPVFGVKGGAAGGGYAQVIPMEDINLHFTGDFHAIGAANNLLAAMLDNHIYQGNALNIDPRRITWRRAVDMNDRQLRFITDGLGGRVNGVPREDGFDITVASEVMAVLCLAGSLPDLKARLSRMVVGYTYDEKPVTAGDLKAAGAMAALLKDALKPNLVQTLEGTPAFVHGGPFANIAHGCNSVIATRMALKLGDYAVTEAGFGADLGAEKFFDIKCRAAGLRPDAVVVVATVRAVLSEVWGRGGKGGEALAREVVRLCAEETGDFRFAYDSDDSLRAKIEAVARRVYRAENVSFTALAERELAQLEALGFGSLPVCMAKTQYSFSDDAKKLGAPEGFTLTVRKLRVSAGAGFVVALTGDIMTMPGLPKSPAAERIDVDENGVISGLF